MRGGVGGGRCSSEMCEATLIDSDGWHEGRKGGGDMNRKIYYRKTVLQKRSKTSHSPVACSRRSPGHTIDSFPTDPTAEAKGLETPSPSTSVVMQNATEYKHKKGSYLTGNFAVLALSGVQQQQLTESQ